MSSPFPLHGDLKTVRPHFQLKGGKDWGVGSRAGCRGDPACPSRVYELLNVKVNTSIDFINRCNGPGSRFLCTLGLIHYHFACIGVSLSLCGSSGRPYGFVGCIVFFSKDTANLPSG